MKKGCVTSHLTQPLVFNYPLLLFPKYCKSCGIQYIVCVSYINTLTNNRLDFTFLIYLIGIFIEKVCISVCKRFF